MASSTGVDVAHPTYPADDEKAVVGRGQSDRSSSIRSIGHGDGTARKLKSRHSKLHSSTVLSKRPPPSMTDLCYSGRLSKRAINNVLSNYAAT